jgi:hypothetical protein
VARSKQVVALPEGAASLYEANDAVSPSSTVKFGEAKGDKYKVRIISAGEGSSGIYPMDMLERDTPDALPKGSRMRANHDGICEAGGDIRRVIARTIDTPWREGEGMYTNIQLSSQWSEFVQEFGDIIGLSISMAGEYEEIPEGGEESYKSGYWVDSAGKEHKRVIAHLLPASESPYNSLDFVEAPGADGRIVAALESARGRLAEMNVREQAGFAGRLFEQQISDGAPPRENKEDIEVDEATLRQMVQEAVAAAVPTLAEALTPATPPAEKPTLSATVEAVVAAGLSQEGREAVYEAVEAGKPLEEAITREKAREERIAERIKAEQETREHELPVFGTVFEAGKANESADAEFERLVGVK